MIVVIVIVVSGGDDREKTKAFVDEFIEDSSAALDKYKGKTIELVGIATSVNGSQVLFQESLSNKKRPRLVCNARDDISSSNKGKKIKVKGVVDKTMPAISLGSLEVPMRIFIKKCKPKFSSATKDSDDDDDAKAPTNPAPHSEST